VVSILSLWLPILLSAVFVFIVSSIIHMVLRYHHNDMKPVPDEDKVMEALRPFDLPPGDYGMPRAADMKEMNTPEFQEKMKRGPVAFLTILPGDGFRMGESLVQWFVYSLVVGVIAAYITSRAVEIGADYRTVMRFAGCTAFVGYSLALWQNSIWYKRRWSTTIKGTFDGLIYGLVTGGTFGWLWPS
jgi:hypothetical protein